MMVRWKIRANIDEINLDEAYGGYLTMFSTRLHYSGEFTKLPNRKYVKGKVKYIDLLDSDTFCAHEIVEIVEELHQVKEGESSQGVINQTVDDDDVQTPPTIIDRVQTPPFTSSNYLQLEDFIDGGQTHLEDQFQAPNFEFDLNGLDADEFDLKGHDVDVDNGNQTKDSGEDSKDLSDSDASDLHNDEYKIIDEPEVDMKDFFYTLTRM
ncbi:unnamed protein product [Lactuca saligna]|uniref:PB1-like domain-containing protein n=1 Tax=Lactuca saligna TaxID=75948 RepID=A0AA35YUQ4_LACSI|nr:unnamed protein product [Lactuca saligna]